MTVSEVKKYECTVLIDASCGVTVEASSPEEAAELAENAAAEQGAGSLCHQCSDHTECGDSYAVIVYDGGEEVLDTDYRSAQLKAAQSELAALREELANEKNRYARDVDSADEETSALREIIRDLKDWRECSQSLAAFASILERAESVIPAPGPLRQRLTDAEQRNAEAESLLHDASIQLAGWVKPTDFPRSGIIAFLSKPAESGASE